MKSKKLKEGSPGWISAWETLLTKGVVIRSYVEFKHESSTFETQLIFKKNAEDLEIHRVECRRTLGNPIALPTTKLMSSKAPLGDYLGDLFSPWPSSIYKSWKYLEPTSHIALINRFCATDRLLLLPSHPLLMLYYGMVYELIVTRKRNRTEDDGKLSYNLTVELWEILKHRFGAFLLQQKVIAVENTLGQILV